MKSYATPDFWTAYAKLPQHIQQQAKKSYQQWRENSQYPSLHFKKASSCAKLILYKQHGKAFICYRF